MTNPGSSRPAGENYGDVRASIDQVKLNAYLAGNVPAATVPVDIKQFKFGQSNPTYFLTDARGARFVLRKKTCRKTGFSNSTPSREGIQSARRDPSIQHSSKHTSGVESACPASFRAM